MDVYLHHTGLLKVQMRRKRYYLRCVRDMAAKGQFSQLLCDCAHLSAAFVETWPWQEAVS